MKSIRDLGILDTYGDIFPMILTQQVRYNNRNRIHSEDLAQHSFIVAYNILKIGYNYKINSNIVYKACAMAISHDCPEVFTSDIPHDCKQAHPELKSILLNIEKEFINNKMPELASLYDEYSTQENLTTLLVDLADSISVLQYVNREIAHGNNDSDIQIIKNESSERVILLFDKLKKFLNEENN